MVTTITTFQVPIYNDDNSNLNDNDDHNNLNDNDDPLTTNIKGLLAYNIGKRHKSWEITTTIILQIVASQSL